MKHYYTKVTPFADEVIRGITSERGLNQFGDGYAVGPTDGEVYRNGEHWYLAPAYPCRGGNVEVDLPEFIENLKEAL